MSLTGEDLLQIRVIVEDVFDRKIEPIAAEIKGLRNDVKEIYDMLAKLEDKTVTADESLQKLPVKEQVLRLNAAIVALAQKEGVTLPR